MPRTVDLFIDSDLPLAQLALRVGEVVGRTLLPSPDGSRFVLHDEGVTAYLAEHDFLDDDDLPLSEFRYVLSASVRESDNFEDSAEVSYLRRANTSLRQATGLSSLLVLDLELPDPSQPAR